MKKVSFFIIIFAFVVLPLLTFAGGVDNPGLFGDRQLLNSNTETSADEQVAENASSSTEAGNFSLLASTNVLKSSNWLMWTLLVIIIAGAGGYWWYKKGKKTDQGSMF